MSGVTAHDVDAMKNVLLKLRGVSESTSAPTAQPTYPVQPTYPTHIVENNNDTQNKFAPINHNSFFDNSDEFDMDAYYQSVAQANQSTYSQPVVDNTPLNQVSYNNHQAPTSSVKPMKYIVAAEMISDAKASGKYVIFDDTGKVFKSGLTFKEGAFLIKDLLESTSVDKELLDTAFRFEEKYSALINEYKMLKTKSQSYAVLGETANAAKADVRIKEISNQIKDMRESMKSIRDGIVL